MRRPDKGRVVEYGAWERDLYGMRGRVACESSWGRKTRLAFVRPLSADRWRLNF